jgi:MFS family permease
MTRSGTAEPTTGAPNVSAILRALTATAFLPVAVFEIGNGAIAPVVALSALDLGASPAHAGFVVGLTGIGQMLGDIPSAWLADRLGDRRAMTLAAGLTAVAQLGCALAPSLLLIGICLTAIGMCTATVYLARQSYLIDVVPPTFHARAMSTLGGSHRIGLFVGPFVGAGVISLAGIRAAYVVAVVTSVIVVVLLAAVPDSKSVVDNNRLRNAVTARSTLVTHRALFATLGAAVLAVSAVRAARQTVLPLWANHIGLSPATTSVIFGIASAVDMALFYPAGKVMDEHGRLAVVLPSTIILGASMAVLPLTGGLVALTLVAILMSAGNGIGSGMMMTLGADVAPRIGRTQFLSIWRLVGDAGTAAGPLVVASVATLWALGAGIIAVGALGILASAGLTVWVPRYSPHATRAAVRGRTDDDRSSATSASLQPNNP